jgi:negative regulator of flagellin synthesis FlgM
MKIGNPLDKPGLTPVSGNRGSTAPVAGAGKAANPESSSTVALSSAATSLLDSTDPEFDAGKVERISGAISRGDYTVNPEAIADKLLANAKELLSRPH